MVLKNVMYLFVFSYVVLRSCIKRIINNSEIKVDFQYCTYFKLTHINKTNIIPLYFLCDNNVGSLKTKNVFHVLNKKIKICLF